MSKEFQAKEKSGQEKESPYRNSRSIVQSQAVDEVRRGDWTQAVRGVFQAGLMACALGADSAEESQPYMLKLVQETQDPGWVLAQAAIEADSAPMLQALIQTGLLKKDEKVWSGFRTQLGTCCREFTCEKAAVHAGAHRCLKYLLEIMPSTGLLGQAALEGWPQTFELLLTHSVKLGLKHEIDQALADRVGYLKSESSSERMGTEAVFAALVKAGASLSFHAGAPPDWVSWNGSTSKNIDWVWVPALRLCEPEDELPPGSTRDGSMVGNDFFAQWSTGCRLVRTATEGGANSASARTLVALEDWEGAAAPGTKLTPLALMAMVDPIKTDSGLRRTVLNIDSIILNAKYLGGALADTGPLSLVKCAVGRWLWGGLAAVPKADEVISWVPEHVPKSPLIEALGDICQRLCIRPLGVSGAHAAAQEFIGKMSKFGPLKSKVTGNSWGGSRERTGDNERIERERIQEANVISQEWRLAKSLSHLMESSAGATFLDVVLSVHKSVDLTDLSERFAAKELAILSVGAPAKSFKSSPRM